MSDEPEPKDNGADWKMPEPIFRSTEGHTPKRITVKNQDEVDTESPDVYSADEVDTLSPDFFEADTEIPNVSEIDAEAPDLSELPTEIPNGDEQIPDDKLREEVSPDAPTDPSIKPVMAGGCLKSMVTIVGVITLFAAAIVIAIVYFLFYFRSADTSTF